MVLVINPQAMILKECDQKQLNDTKVHFFTEKPLIHKLLLNRKPYGPYMFVVTLETTCFCLARD